MPRTIEQLAQEALDVQDACNLSGVAHGMARACVDLRDILGAERADEHPIMMLWADKIASLVGTQNLGDTRVGAAYRAVYAIVEAKEKEAQIQRII